MLRPAQRVCSGNGDAYQGFQERLSTCALHGRTTPGTRAPRLRPAHRVDGCFCSTSFLAEDGKVLF